MTPPRRDLARRRSCAVILLAAACSSAPPPFRRDTRVGAERMVAASDPALAAYFAAVYGHQRALGGVVRRRMDGLAALADVLGLPENADRDALAQGLREALRADGVTGVEVEPGEEDGEELVEAWHRALLDPAPDEAAMRAQIDARFAAVRASVSPRLRPSPPPGLVPVFAAVAELLRDAESTRRCMQRLTGAVAAPLRRGAELNAAHPELAAEFAAAETAVLGFHVRAARHAQESLRVAQWLEDALRASGAVAPAADAGARAQ